jgi:hypothetical protein
MAQTATDAPGEKSGKGPGYPRVGLKKRVEEKICGPSEIQVRGWVSPQKVLETIAKIFRISEPSLDVTPAACPLIG